MVFERNKLFDSVEIIHKNKKTTIIVGNPGYDKLHQTLGKEGGEKMVVLPAGYEGRLDLLSTKIYGRPDYWWYLALANGVENPEEELVAGRVLIVPEI